MGHEEVACRGLIQNNTHILHLPQRTMTDGNLHFLAQSRRFTWVPCFQTRQQEPVDSQAGIDGSLFSVVFASLLDLTLICSKAPIHRRSG